MVKSRSSTTTISLWSSSSINTISRHDDSRLKSRRPAKIDVHHGFTAPELVSPTTVDSPLPSDASLPVTPATPFPSDPFSHPTSLPEPTKARPESLATQARARTRKATGSRDSSVDRAPQIVLASPSTQSVHYLFPSQPSLTGTHLSVTERTVSRGASLRSTRRIQAKPVEERGRKLSHPADAFSAPTRSDKLAREREARRRERLASEPAILNAVEETVEMPTLRRRPSLVNMKQARRWRDEEKENLPEQWAPKVRLDVVELIQFPDALAPSGSNRSVSALVSKSAISAPMPYTPPQPPRKLTQGSTPKEVDVPRRSLSSPRPAPPLPETLPASPRLPKPNFGASLSDHLDSSSSIDPVAFPGGVAMERETRGRPWNAGRLAMERDMEARQAAQQPIPLPPSDPASLVTRVRRSLSLKSSSEERQTRRRSQSVVAKPPKEWSQISPLPPRLPLFPVELGLGDPGVDLGDRYGSPITRVPALLPSLPVSTPVLGLEVNARPRFPLHPNLNASQVSLLASPSTVGLGFSPLDSPISLPESLVAEAVDLTEHGRMGRKASFSTCGSSCADHAVPSELSDTVSPNPSSATSVSPSIATPPQLVIDAGSPERQENTTRYSVSSRMPRLRYSKSFTSDTSREPQEDEASRIDSKRLNRLSRSISMRFRRQAAESAPRTEDRVSRTWSIKRKPSLTSSHWRPPSAYSCLPNGAMEPFHSPERRLAIPAPVSPIAEDVPVISITPESVCKPAKRAADTSSSLAPSTRSPFLAASSSIGGSIRTLTRSISRTFDRPSPAVKQADSALKAKISSPLEATRELRVRAEAERALSRRPEPDSRTQKEDKAWRESLLAQAVSSSFKESLNELAAPPVSEPEPRETSSWGSSMGKAFMRTSVSFTARSVSDGIHSFGRRSRIFPSTSKDRGMSTEQSFASVSVYSTATIDERLEEPIDVVQAEAIPAVNAAPPAPAVTATCVSHWSPPAKGASKSRLVKRASVRARSPPPPAEQRFVSDPPYRSSLLEPIPATPVPSAPERRLRIVNADPVGKAEPFEYPPTHSERDDGVMRPSPEKRGERSPTPPSPIHSCAASISIRLSKGPTASSPSSPASRSARRRAQSVPPLPDLPPRTPKYAICSSDLEQYRASCASTPGKSASQGSRRSPPRLSRASDSVLQRLTALAGPPRSSTDRSGGVAAAAEEKTLKLKVLEWRDEVGDKPDMAALEGRIEAFKREEREVLRGIAKRESGPRVR